MFGKKPEPKPAAPSQSQSLSNVTLNGGMVQLGQAGRDLQQQQSGTLDTEQQGLGGADVIKLLETLETAVKTAGLSTEQQEAVLDYLKPAKREAAKETPSKELVGQNLKQVSETLKTLKDTTETGKSLWQTGQDVFSAIAPWLGVAATFF
jgi:hypothetical protein